MSAILDSSNPAPERRRIERRTTGLLSDLTIPELRRMVITTVLGIIVLSLFLWMVRTVIIAAILGLVIGVYARPLYRLIHKYIPKANIAAILALIVLITPVLAALVYAYEAIIDAATYVTKHNAEIASRINLALAKLPMLGGASAASALRTGVMTASNYGTAIPLMVRATLAHFAVSATIFLFTAFYVFTSAEELVSYVRFKVPPRYRELAAALERNVNGVLYGAIYATLLTQTLKSLVIWGLCWVFSVPLAPVLAIMSFIIGFFPIVGSWSVYLPVAAWLLIFRESVFGAITVMVVGTLLNTLFISMYLRPKLAADKSRVLNFYWMFVGLVTGVYTFGLVGILLGPILIGLLKAVVDTVTAQSSWRILDTDEEPPTEGIFVDVR